MLQTIYYLIFFKHQNYGYVFIDTALKQTGHIEKKSMKQIFK